VGEWTLTGDPDQEYGGIRADDVALTLRSLEPGFHPSAEVWARYGWITGKSPGSGVTAIITKMGMTPFMIDGERGWRIDPARLAEKWPRLPR
jgi:hypothetical protein